jgi:hypothetical protein
MFIRYIGGGVGHCVINSTQGTEGEKSMDLGAGDVDGCEAAAEEDEDIDYEEDEDGLDEEGDLDDIEEDGSDLEDDDHDFGPEDGDVDCDCDDDGFGDF